MDDLVRDPEMAPQLFELLNKKLKSTRDALEGMKKDNDTLRAEVVMLESAQRNSGGMSSQDEAALRDEIGRAREENTRLHEDIAGFRQTIEETNASRAAEARVQRDTANCTGANCQWKFDLQRREIELAEAHAHLEQQGRAYEEMRERVVEQNEELARARAADEDSRRHASRVEDTLDAKQKECEQLESRLDAALQQIMKNGQDLSAKLEQFEESRQKWRAKEDELVKSKYALKQELELVTNKYWRYKTKFVELSKPPPPAQAAPAHDRVPPSSAPAAQPPAQSSAPPSATNEQSEPVLSKPWHEIVQNVLDNPCFPPRDYRAPFHLPPHVRDLIPPGTSVLCTPNRLLFPSGDGLARVIAPAAHCRGARAATALQAPSRSRELERHVGGRREVFYTSEHGIFYAGTFVGGAVADVPRAEYAQLPKHVKEAVLRHTFPSKAEFSAASHADTSRVRNLYMNGAWTTRALALRYVGRNEPLADALLALGAVQRVREDQAKDSHGRPQEMATDRAAERALPERPRTPHRERQRRDDRARTPPPREDRELWDRARDDACASPEAYVEPRCAARGRSPLCYYDDEQRAGTPSRDARDASPAAQEWDALARLTPESMGRADGGAPWPGSHADVGRARTPPYAGDGMVDRAQTPPECSSRAREPRNPHRGERRGAEDGVTLASRITDERAASPPWSPDGEGGSDEWTRAAGPLSARLSEGRARSARVRTKRRAEADEGGDVRSAKRVCSGASRREVR